MSLAAALYCLIRHHAQQNNEATAYLLDIINHRRLRKITVRVMAQIQDAHVCTQQCLSRSLDIYRSDCICPLPVLLEQFPAVCPG